MFPHGRGSRIATARIEERVDSSSLIKLFFLPPGRSMKSDYWWLDPIGIAMVNLNSTASPRLSGCRTDLGDPWQVQASQWSMEWPVVLEQTANVSTFAIPSNGVQSADAFPWKLAFTFLPIPFEIRKGFKVTYRLRTRLRASRRAVRSLTEPDIRGVEHARSFVLIHPFIHLSRLNWIKTDWKVCFTPLQASLLLLLSLYGHSLLLLCKLDWVNAGPNIAQLARARTHNQEVIVILGYKDNREREQTTSVCCSLVRRGWCCCGGGGSDYDDG